MKQKVLYMILAACLFLVNASDIFAKGKKKVEDPEISKLKGKIENVMQKDAHLTRLEHISNGYQQNILML